MIKSIFYFAVVCLLFLTVVVPNSFPAFTAAVLVMCSLVALLLLRWSEYLVLVIGLYFANVLITLFYIFLGLMNGAPFEAANQVFLVYILSPILWITIFAVLMTVVSEKEIRFCLVIFSFLCFFSIGIFFYLYLNFGEGAVSLFQESANVDTSNGYVGATMHVYGSLIFLTGGFFASPCIARNKIVRFILLSGLVVAALTSGRSALILAAPVGLFVGILFLRRSSILLFEVKDINPVGILFSSIFIIGIGAFGWFFIPSSGVDLNLIVDVFMEKLSSGGGEARTEQFNALLDGVFDSWGLGVGHGIGVDYLRNEDFPWRYELVWLATLLRVGVFGSLIYFLPFALYILSFLKVWWQRGVSDIDVFMFSGFLCAFLASNTNPYIEGFAFQWMYVLPVVHFLVRRSLDFKNKSEASLVADF